MVKATPVIAPASAPFPVDFALKGIVSFHTRYRINPTTGKKKPKTPNPVDLASCGFTWLKEIFSDIVVSFNSLPH